MRPAGIEPTHPAWQAGRLPLHHGRKTMQTKLSKIIRAPGRTRTGVAAVRERSLRRYFVIRHLLSGSPGNRTQCHPVISRVRATSPRLPCKSERSDSNRRSLGPKPSAIPNFATFCFQYPVRESNPHLQIESLLSLPLDQRGMLCFVVRAPGAQSGLGGARILVCGSSDRRYTVSATSPYSNWAYLFDREEPTKKGPVSL